MTIDEIFKWAVPEPNSGCWIWLGCISDGYGQKWRDGRMHVAHRLTYESLKGPVPEDLHLDHLCRIRCCVNPDHLEPVSCKENLLRGETFAARNSAKTHCKRGHEFTVENTYVYTNMRHCRECRRLDMARRRAEGLA